MNSALAEPAVRLGFGGVMRNYVSELTECTTANLFVVKDGVTMTGQRRQHEGPLSEVELPSKMP